MEISLVPVFATASAAVNNLLVVGALLFAMGMIGFLARRNLIVMFLCAELMLQGVSLTLVAFGREHGTWSGQIFALFSLALAASEAAIALALIVMLFRRGQSLDVSLWQDLREEGQPPVDDETQPIGMETEEPSPRLTVAGLLPSRRRVVLDRKPVDPANQAAGSSETKSSSLGSSTSGSGSDSNPARGREWNR